MEVIDGRCGCISTARDGPGARLRLLWEQAHGSPAGEAHVLIGPNSVAASLDDVLSLAKRAVIKRADGQRLMERYAEQLLAVIQPELQAHVEAAVGRHVVTGSIHSRRCGHGARGVFLSPGRTVSAATRRRG